MNWAEERARELEGIFNCTSSREPLIKAIAAELQRVANECANETLIANQFGFRPYDAIRARFPKEEL